MNDKLKVLCTTLFYPVSIGRYIIEELQARDDLEVKTIGPAFGTWIPWNGGLNLPAKYAFNPDIAIPAKANTVSMSFAEMMLGGWEPDVIMQFDAGWHFTGRPKHGLNVQYQSDPHCVSGDTFIATNLGIRTIDELAGVENLSVCDGGGFKQADEIVFSGYKRLVTYELETGQWFSVTPDHLVETEDGLLKEAIFLKVGDKVNLYCGTYHPRIGTDEDYSKGFIYGAFQGDGSFGSSDIVKFTLGKEKKQEVGKAICKHALDGFGIDTVTYGKHYTCENAFILSIRRMGLFEQLKKAELKSGHVPLCVRTGTRAFVAGYFAGLLATDGCSVDGRIQITTKYRKLAEEWQTILFYFGIPTKVAHVVSGKGSFKPGQKYATLYVKSGFGQTALHELCGDIPGREIGENSRTVLAKEGSKQSYEIVSIVGDARALRNKGGHCLQPVYDVVNTSSNMFLANGVSVHNCLKDFYRGVRGDFDLVFCSQTPYMDEGEVYMPYAYSDRWFYPEEQVKIYDACMIGIPYNQRVHLANALKREGINVFMGQGIVFDEYREMYNKSKIALSWSSLQDTPMRVYEAMGMALPLIANRTPDLCQQFVDGYDFRSFDSIQEAVMKVWITLNSPESTQAIARSGYQKAVSEYTWKKRVQDMLDVIKEKI